MSTVRRIWMYGQSNMVWLNNTAPGSPANDILRPVLRQLIDPDQAECIVTTQYDLAGTCFSGIGSAFTNAAMTQEADGFYGPAGNSSLVRPRAPGQAGFETWTEWPLTGNASSRIAYASGLPAGTRAEIACILAMHSEYDTKGYADNGWAANDPRVVEFAWRRMIGALRAALGKTPADCPVLATIAVPYVPGGAAGFNAVNQAILNLEADPAFNLRIICEQTMDMTWDRDGPAGAYTWHANNADLALLSRRIARGIAREMGPVWAPTAFRSRPSFGPRAIWAQRVDAGSVDVWIRHDGGGTLTLNAADPARGWSATYNGQTVGVTGAAVLADGRRIRLTLGSACPSDPMLAIRYGWGNVRLLPAGGAYDDAASFDPKAIAPGVSGADRLNDALLRTRVPLPVRADPPPSHL